MVGMHSPLARKMAVYDINRGFPTRGPHVAREAILCGLQSQMLSYIHVELMILKPKYSTLRYFGLISPMRLLI